MENLAPPLILLWDVKRALEKGQSVSTGIKNYLKRPKDDLFNEQIEIWWFSQQNSRIFFDKKQISYHRRYLLEILEQGLKGQGILNSLYLLETEIIISCDSEIHLYVTRLPLISLIPLTFLIFPSMILLLVAPLLKLLQF
ncbi:hypothetical protein K2P97_02480 [bacterium]|nr:hypothetical protein [bacterium]